jgi:multiple sugar transport system permease protein
MAAITTPTGAATAPAASRRRRRRGKASRFTPGVIVSYVLVSLYALTMIIPLYWVLISAFKKTADMIGSPFVPSFTAGVEQFQHVWRQLSLGDALISSLYITVASLVLTIVVAVPASYAIARSKGRIGVIFERIYAVGFLIPGFASLLPTLLLAIKMDLFYTREFMILYMPASAQPLAVILLTQFMRTVPAELEESATIDGAGRLRILRSVYLPLTIPGIATVAILNFIGFWNEYLYALLIVGLNPELRTIQVALPVLQGNQGITDYGMVCAGTVIAVLPVFLVYAVLNRRMENALVQGALKG